MGILVYGGGAEFEFDDRVLAHLKIAIVSKLRLQESFLINWTLPPSAGSGRASLWISPGTPLQFRFAGSKRPELNRVWLDAMSRSSHGVRGMVVMSEEEAADYLKAAGNPSAL